MLTKPSSFLSERAVTVENRTDFEIDLQQVADLVEFLRGALDINESTSVDVTFVDEGAMTELHVRYMGLPGPTDVLSFPSTDVVNGAVDPKSLRHEHTLGDIVICPIFVRNDFHRRDQLGSMTPYLLHGFLHLVGYSHEDQLTGDVMNLIAARLQDLWLRYTQVEQKNCR